MVQKKPRLLSKVKPQHKKIIFKSSITYFVTGNQSITKGAGKYKKTEVVHY